MELIFLPLLKTIAVECLLAAVIFRRGRTVYAVLLCNVLTNPVLNALLFYLTGLFGRTGYQWGLPVLETAAVITEAWVLHYFLGWNGRKSAGISVFLNLASFLSGLFV